MSGCYCMILTGHPCSGKTTIASKIQDRVTIYDPTIQVIIVQDHTNNSSDNNNVNIIYGTNEMEKKSRGLLKNSFDRIVASNSSSNASRKTLVILDSMNYIKGYRYELYCISKACGCYYGIVWCLSDVTNVYAWNETAGSSDTTTTTTTTTYYRYNPKLLQELILRYEPPDERNRWDRPLYKLQNHHRLKAASSSTSTDPAITTKTTTTDQDVLARSVYNMHNLADVIQSKSNTTTDTKETTTAGATTAAAATTTTATDPTSQSQATKPKKLSASSTFKRSGNKKTISKLVNIPTSAISNNNNNNSLPSVQNTTTHIAIEQTLTAEALASLNRTTTKSSGGSIGAVDDNDDDDEYNDTGSNSIGNDRTTINYPPRGSSKSQSQARVPSRTTIDTTTSIEEQIDGMIRLFFATTNKPLSEGTSTRQHIATNSDVLQLVDSVTQQICSTIVSCQEHTSNPSTTEDETILLLPPLVVPNNLLKDSSSNPSSSSNTVTSSNSNDHRMKLRRPKTKPYYTSNDLRHLRNQYIQWCVKNPPENHSSYQSIAQQFVSYIEAQEI